MSKEIKTITNFSEMELSEDMCLAPTSALNGGSGQLTAPMQSSLETREMADIKAKVFMAKQFPRNIAEVTKMVDSECSRVALASQAVYTYPRGDRDITGPSIRLAETLARCMGNITSATEVLSQTEEASLVRVSAWDYEANRQASRTFIVRHERDKSEFDRVTRTKKKVKEKLTDNRDIMEMINNIAARNRRAVILELIPGDLVDRAVHLCSKTLAAKVNITPELIDTLIKSFEGFGVSKAMIEERIQRKAEAISVQQVLELRQIFTSLRDGVGKPESFFNMNIETQSDERQAMKGGVKKTASPKKKEASEKSADQTPDSVPQAHEAASSPVIAEEATGNPFTVPENEYDDADDGLEGPEAYGDDDIDF